MESHEDTQKHKKSSLKIAKICDKWTKKSIRRNATFLHEAPAKVKEHLFNLCIFQCHNSWLWVSQSSPRFFTLAWGQLFRTKEELYHLISKYFWWKRLIPQRGVPTQSARSCWPLLVSSHVPYPSPRLSTTCRQCLRRSQARIHNLLQTSSRHQPLGKIGLFYLFSFPLLCLHCVPLYQWMKMQKVPIF